MYPPHTHTCHHLLPSSFSVLGLASPHWINSTAKPSFKTQPPSLSLLPSSHQAMMMSSSSSSKTTDQILSRYRPIAPKPPLVEGPPTPENTQQSPFSKKPSFLLTRPSRSRKRGTKSGYLPASKRGKTPRPRPTTTTTTFSSPCGVGVASLAKNTQLGLSLQSFAHGFHPPPQFTCLDKQPLNLVTLPFLPYPSTSSSVPELHASNICTQFQGTEIPQEMDLLQILQATHSAPLKRNVIAPQAVRLVGSSISVECIQEDRRWNFSSTDCVLKKPEEVEAEIELDSLPAVVSDSNNRVRLANSAYMEMVGQPECLWLNSMANCGHSKGKRIGGKVILDLLDARMPASSDGFTCRVKIEWGSNEENKSSINAHCDVVKLSCKSKDYLFKWRFHTRESSESISKA